MDNPTSASTAGEARILRRPNHGRMIAGVAAGAADYFGIDVTIVRIILVVLALFGGAGVPLYLAAWLLVPDECSDVSVAEELLDQFRSR
jgi:phage shock protein PspC (stress-responsive transcriptional regulator)